MIGSALRRFSKQEKEKSEVGNIPCTYMYMYIMYMYMYY